MNELFQHEISYQDGSLNCIVFRIDINYSCSSKKDKRHFLGGVVLEKGTARICFMKIQCLKTDFVAKFEKINELQIQKRCTL